MSKVLTAEEILKANDQVIEPVDVPEWGGRVFVKSTHSGIIDAFEANVSDDKQKGANFRAKLVALTACDEAGNLLFNERHVAVLATKSPVAMRRVARVAMKLNAQSAEAVEDAKKNSDADPSDGSPTGSP